MVSAWRTDMGIPVIASASRPPGPVGLEALADPQRDLVFRRVQITRLPMGTRRTTGIPLDPAQPERHRPWGVAPHPTRRPGGREAGRKALPPSQPDGGVTRSDQVYAPPVPPFDGASPDEPGARHLTGAISENGKQVVGSRGTGEDADNQGDQNARRWNKPGGLDSLKQTLNVR